MFDNLQIVDLSLEAIQPILNDNLKIIGHSIAVVHPQVHSESGVVPRARRCG